MSQVRTVFPALPLPAPPLPTSASSGAARGPSEAERLAPGLLAFRSGACGVGGECRGQEERGGRNTRARCPDVPGGLGGGLLNPPFGESFPLLSVILSDSRKD